MRAPVLASVLLLLSPQMLTANLSAWWLESMEGPGYEIAVIENEEVTIAVHDSVSTIDGVFKEIGTRMRPPVPSVVVLGVLQPEVGTRVDDP